MRVSVRTMHVDAWVRARTRAAQARAGSIDTQCSRGWCDSYTMRVWCAKTAWAHWRQARMVEFVNNREETIANGVAKAIARHGDGVRDVRAKSPL